MSTRFSVFFALLFTACGASDPVAPVPPPPPPPPPPAPVVETIVLPVRVHVMSSRLGELSATFSNEEITGLFDRANEVWAQGAVEWQIESIIQENLLNEDQIEMGLAGTIPLTFDLVFSGLPRANLTGLWDVFIVRDLAVVGAPGVYASSIPLVVSSEVDPAGINDPGRILAHELGHSLSLPHVPCTAAGNLMSPGCAGSDRTRLTQSQINQSRAQAETLTPSG